MANENLRSAIYQAGLTDEQFADIVGVDPKTVQRWIAGRFPRPRHRAAIARALDLSEGDLWPDSALPGSAPGAPGAVAPDAGDVVGSWGYADDLAAPDPAQFIAQTPGPLIVYDGDWQSLFETSGVVDAAEAGRMVCVLTFRPTARLRPLVKHPRVRVKCSWEDMWATAIRAQDAMLLTLRLTYTAGTPLPTLLCKRSTEDGFFDRLSDHLDLLWEQSDATLDTVEDLDEIVAARFNDPPSVDEYADDLGPDSSASAQRPADRQPADASDRPHALNVPGTTESDSKTRRRWPRPSS